ncbi:P63C domain-containing protein, partial [Abditibacterium utsteinense]
TSCTSSTSEPSSWITTFTASTDSTNLTALDHYPKELLENSKPILFSNKKGVSFIGYRADLLPQVCYVFIDADEQNVLRDNQKQIAAKCRLLVRGFASVGLTALIDEATGYQEVRDKKALHEILSRYISGELLEWTKMFPDEFYKELFRLRGWQYHNLSVKRPILVGKLTVDLIYKRLAPGVYAKLKEVNPKNEKGRLKQPYTRWLTDEEGKPALDRHIFAVTTMMRGSSNWEGFKRLLDRSLPGQNQNLPLPGLDWNNFNDSEEGE